MSFVKYEVRVNADFSMDIKFFLDGLAYEGSASLGYPGKHGIQGICREDLLCFEGAKVLFQPDFFYLDEDIHIDFIDIDIIKNGEHFKYSLKNADWFTLHDLRKRCFAIGEFDIYCPDDGLNVLFEKKYPAAREKMCDKIKYLYGYYKNLFGNIYSKGNGNIYAVYVFDRYNGKNIFAGAGMSSQGSTFFPDEQRDIELLSHRMFHAFFDSAFKNKYLLIPPYLWLYEGLAVYCETESVRELTGKNGWEALERRYRYALNKYGDKLKLDPMLERKYISCGYKMEFLHYTQAPLIIKENGGMEIIELLKKGFSPEDIARNLKTDIIFEEFDEALDEDLRYFDYILKTWGI